MNSARARRFRCSRTRFPGTGSGRWPGGGCWARAPSRCSLRAPGIRWPGCCWRCGAGRHRAAGGGPAGLRRRLKDGYYGLAATLLTLVFLALAGEPRAEGATRVPPAALGRVLGLDRAPEVKTIRRKLGGARHRRRGRGPDHGAGPPPRRYPPPGAGVPARGRARACLLRHPGRAEDAHRTAEVPRPATVETWVTGQDGEPVFMVAAEPSDSLAGELRRLLPQLRQVVGEGGG